ALVVLLDLLERVEPRAAIDQLLAQRDELRLVLHELAAAPLQRLLLAGAARLEVELELAAVAQLLHVLLAETLELARPRLQFVALGLDALDALLEVGLLANQVLQVALARRHARERGHQRG